MTKFINLHTHNFSNNEDVLEVVNQYPWEFDDAVPNYSIGVHPWYIDNERLQTDLNFIKEQLNLNECLAMGECGLDKRIEIPFQNQLKYFNSK